ncbi:MAG: sigma 54-interacting transcriptional regulator [Acidobacteriota bacterium]
MAFRILARFDDQTIRATLHDGKNVLGSDASCDVCLPNSTVSRRHAVITVDGESTVLSDLQSTNGTLLRSERIESAPVAPGDIFVIGRVVVLLEEVLDDDLEVGIDVNRAGSNDPSGVVPVPLDELTETFSPLDHFTLDHLPRVLAQLSSDTGRQKTAQRVGFALYETMPVTAVEILETREGGVLYEAAAETLDAEAPGGESPADPGDAEWIEAENEALKVRCCFFKKSVGEHYRPVVESALHLVGIAGRLRGEQPRQAKRRRTVAERPQPPSVEAEVQKIYDQAERVARGDVGVMIYGESGTGKEVLAHFLHGASPRASKPLVAINCASLPKDLLEAELFGVERGVATGVEARAGKFEAANEGTLFLDEIGDMAPETQAKILRVLQEKEVFRLGGHTPRPAKARIIAATNRPIHEMLQEGSFRSDLYHRIATWEVELPPLRRRRQDIPNLAAHFLSQEAERYSIRVRGISRAALQVLRRYRWPGNIRQLRNEIARAALFLENKELLDTGRLSSTIRGQRPTQIGGSLADILEAVERDEIAQTLDSCGGDTSLAAEKLSISRPTLYRRLKSLGIELPGTRTS